MLFIHLVPGDGFHKQVTLIDRLSSAYSLDLGDFEFLLQKCADPILPTIAARMNEKKNEEAEKVIDGLFTLFHKRLDKGILHIDPTIVGNLGFSNGVAMQIDIGRFFIPTRPEQYKIELERFQTKNRFFST